jgi:hypothetical protein
MAFTSDQLTALENAIAEGALEVQYSDKRVKYRSLDEMMKIREMMRRDLGVTTSTDNRTYARFSKGT